MWRLWLRRPEDGQLEKVPVGTTVAGRQEQVFPKPCLRESCDVDEASQEERISSLSWDQNLQRINGSLGADPMSWSSCTGLLDACGAAFSPHLRLALLGITCCREKRSQHVWGCFPGALQTHVPGRGSWVLLPSQEPELRGLFPADTKDHAWEEPLIENGEPGVPEEPTFQVKAWRRRARTPPPQLPLPWTPPEGPGAAPAPGGRHPPLAPGPGPG
ncbi:unconventional myosin-XIX-like [Dasypus novemcinctus]|uniref:unconventional myosin-XIX-like n=1 Tax=Dasypus novemcinctus TaxID=9361 RepID=UPI00265EDE3F|nr:uncharacterized protein LOC111761409 [Dasypus novemcinctus]